MDTMKSTKIVAGLCGSLLVFMLGGWAASAIYGGGGGHHGAEGEHDQGYLIEVAASGDGDSGAEQALPFEDVMAAADPAKGEKVFSKCKACHSLTAGENKTGPSLHGVVNRKVDTEAGFSYSGALEKVADTWTPENLYHFLENPKKFAPGTAMSFSGLKKDTDRADLIAYLEQQGG